MNIIRLTIFCFVILYSSNSIAETGLGFFFKNSEQYTDVLIKEVISADTFELESGEEVKMIGLRAPEAPRKITERVIKRTDST